MNPSDVLKYGHLTLLRSLDSVPQAEWTQQGVCGVWGVKEIVGHLASYELMLTEVLSPFAGIQMPTPIMELMGRARADFNDIEVANRQEQTPAEALAEYTEAFRRNMEEIVPKVPPEMWSKTGTLPWYGNEYSLDDYIVYTFYGHKREHSAQVDAFRDKLSRG